MEKLLNFVVLDIETTGFDFKENEIIEIGAVCYEKGKKISTFSKFIKPQKKVPLFIKQLTHITDEMLKSGESLTSVLPDLKTFIGNLPVICHNISFDIGFLNEKLSNCGISRITNKLFDTVELARIYLPFISNHKLTTVANYFEIDLSNAHRAIYDAQATAEVYLKIIDFIENNINLRLNYQILQIAKIADINTDLVFFLDEIVKYQKKYALLRKTNSTFSYQSNNYINHKPAKPKENSVAEVFDKNGLFDNHLDNYEIRQGQIHMADAVENNFAKNEYLLIEAGTGVGKSFAYLVPAIMHSAREKEKVVISTNTKNLQEQLFFKDIPFVKECVTMPFSAVLLKGRRNYICEKKWQEISMDPVKLINSYDAQQFMNLFVWKEFTKTGDISENNSFNINRNSSIWKNLMADRHFCRGRKCSFFNRCYLMDIRKKAEKSNLVVINHYLLLADLSSENSALGNYKNLIIDEAHNLPHIAPQELGLSLGYSDFNSFFHMLFNKKNRFQGGVISKLKSDTVKSAFGKSKQEVLLKKIEELILFLNDNSDIFKEFFREINNVVKNRGSYGKFRIKNLEDFPFITKYLNSIIQFWAKLSEKTMFLQEQLGDVSSKLFVDHDVNSDNLESVNMRIADFHEKLMSLYNPQMKDFSFWLSNFRTEDEKFPAGILNYAPLNIQDIMNKTLYSNVESIVFTSATIALRGKFKYFSNRMGLNLLDDDLVQELVVESPFDYQKQAVVLIAGMLPAPQDKYFSPQSIQLIEKVVDIAKTGTMILFTSYKDLNNVYEELSDSFYRKNITLLAQGKGMSRSVLMQEFKKNKNSVLLGTNSFWEGVDIPGEALSLLILNKLPFLVPSEPIIEAYIEKLNYEGKNSFMHFMMPNALLKYRQGFGRLIRNKTDRGMVLVLDNRIYTKKYGHYFKEIVPSKTKVMTSPVEIYDNVGSWFSKIQKLKI
ncbi:MAG: DEAD/DEAH box helicase family protein [Candidatus Cloacimonetes bacterium]|nr:DEAD/DEAH box helicase family protein [Candidatus Cloacimonadota bacterium]